MTTRHLLRWAALVVVFGATIAQDCNSFFRCGDCISQNINCAWCNDPDTFTSVIANRSPGDLSPVSLCGTPNYLNDLGCSNIINPRSHAMPDPDTTPGSAQVTPTSADIILRPGQPANLGVTVTPAQSIPIDMYMLMDLSYTLKPDLQTLSTFAAELINATQELTNDFRIAFGSFIDKTTSPFIDTLSFDFPCARDLPSDSSLTPEVCEPPYSFRHTLDFTSNYTAFQETVDNAKLSTSTDAPEAVLDAIMQIALCEDQVGWKPRGESRRIIFTLTDGDYHFALDGRLGGIVNLPKNECMIDSTTGEYTDNALYDYPSTATVADLLTSRDILPIFAVKPSVTQVYEQLRRIIRTATIAELSAQSQNLVTVVRDSYQTLSSTVVPVVTGLENYPIEISVVPENNCLPDGVLMNNTDDICVEVTPPNESVRYTVTFLVDSEMCHMIPREGVAARIQFTGFGSVGMNIKGMCDCGDQCNAPVEDSDVCSDKGTLECSTCLCPEGVEGPTCNCTSVTAGAPGCIRREGEEICSGRGECVCGSCVCDPISEGSDVVYGGDFCESDPEECPKARDENGVILPCTGNGLCVNGKCECNDEYEGSACQCPRDNSGCIGPFDDPSNNETCSGGAGSCRCGRCICENYFERHGQFCHECAPCGGACGVINPCILCTYERGENCDPSDNCSRIVIVNSTSDVPNNDRTRFKRCAVTEGSCELTYQVSTVVTGREDQVYVVLDEEENSRDIDTLRSDPGDCNPELLIWPIPVGIILGIIVVGIIAILLWRCFTYFGEYLEYRAWMKSVKEETSRSGSNPLFVDPNTKYSNPRYRPIQ